MGNSDLLFWAVVYAACTVYEPNGMQMGSIQMPSASSDQLSAYVHWFYWTLLFGQAVINVFILILSIFLDFITAARYTVLYACIVQLVSVNSSCVRASMESQKNSLYHSTAQKPSSAAS